MAREWTASDWAKLIYKAKTDAVIEPQGTESRVCEDIAKRQSLGINKYGTTVELNPAELKEWLQHAYEEALDMAIYLKRAIERMEGK